jgi:hypothetical protein
MSFSKTFLVLVTTFLSASVFAQGKPDLTLLDGSWESPCTNKDGYSYKVIPFIRSAKNLKATDFPGLDRSKMTSASAVVVTFIQVFTNDTCSGKGQTVNPPQIGIWDVEGVSGQIPSAYVLKMTDSNNQVTYDLIANASAEGFELSAEPSGKVAPTTLGHKYSKYTEK